jgi:uncharacterized damage-inducible protein DinB
MSTPQFFAKRLKGEIPAFLKVIRALPEDKLDYKPHEKNTAAGALAWQIACEMASLPGVLENGVIDYRSKECPTLAEVASTFETAANEVVERANAASEERWKGSAKFIYDGHVAWESTVEDMAWGFFLDLIHHRGQLTAYLRPMGGKVPSVYGPTADDKP